MGVHGCSSVGSEERDEEKMRLDMGMVKDNMVFGIRGTYDRMELGERCENSYAWDEEYCCSAEDTTGEKLDGTCAYYIDIERTMSREEIVDILKPEIEKFKNVYCYRYLYLVAGNDSSYGNDENEIVIEHADVVGIIE